MKNVDKAMSIDPNDVDALNGKGYVLSALGNYTEVFKV